MHLIFSRLTLSSSLCRLEQININSRYGVAKVVGTVASVGGATIITLYKGPPLLHHQHHAKLCLGASSNTILNWTLGCVYVLGNCVAWSGWMVLQVSPPHYVILQSMIYTRNKIAHRCLC